jgi:NTE family protein
MQKTAPQHRLDRGLPPFERIALLLQGGGALGAYQAGVYQALAEADLHPNCVSGVSIGAINAALIAGNAPEDRVAALRTFWERITAPPLGFPFVRATLGLLECGGDVLHGMLNQTHALVTATGGAPGFFRPRPVPPFLSLPGTIAAASFYDTSPLRATLEELVDFERINRGDIWFGVGAVNVRTGNLEYFDSANGRIGPEHIMASGALPPGFPAVEINGEHYWDGGLVSNTPLQWVLDASSRKDTLAFQVDLWSARGDMPGDLIGIDQRQKDIRFSSRTRANTDHFKSLQRARRAVRKLLDMVPDHAALNDPDMRMLEQAADEKVYNIVHLIYRAKRYEGSSRDYEFSRETMDEHWSAGHRDAMRALREPAVLRRPETADGVAIFDCTK